MQETKSEVQLDSHELKEIKGGIPYEAPQIYDISILNLVCGTGTSCSDGGVRCLTGKVCSKGTIDDSAATWD